jgi:fused signal recognition particle receptor
MFERFRQQLGGFVKRVSEKELSGEDLEREMGELELILVQNDVALETAEDILEGVKEELSGQRIGRFEKPGVLLKSALKGSIQGIFDGVGKIDLVELLRRKEGKPFKMLFVGINGTGKTTTIAKMAYLLKSLGFTLVLACSDTYRTGAIEQLGIHAERVGVKVIRQMYGADPAAVAYDAVEHARARGIDVVMIDTAGRQHTDYNLMMELSKVLRVVEPDLVILVVDSLTGNDALAQAKEFLRGVGFDGVVLTKMDADAKGGAAVSIVDQTGKPILYVGTGQDYGDLKEFDEREFVETILGKDR